MIDCQDLSLSYVVCAHPLVLCGDLEWLALSVSVCVFGCEALCVAFLPPRSGAGMGGVVTLDLFYFSFDKEARQGRTGWGSQV